MNNGSTIENKLVGLAVSLIASRTKGLNWDDYCRLVRFAGGPANFITFADAATYLAPLIVKLKESQNIRSSIAEIERWCAGGIDCVGLGESNYPKDLSQIADPPKILFSKGEGKDACLSKPLIGIVGARKADGNSLAFARDIARSLATAGCCIVSGLALGIDGAAHEGALSSGETNCTIAVLGNGLASIYPGSHTQLASRIIQQGGVLFSQFEPNEKPLPHNFLNRNRVISGLCRAVIIIQAGERSGSLVTARHAAEQGRDVMVAPGAFYDFRFKGSNLLIKTGAYLISSIDDVFEILPEIASCAKKSKQDSQKSLTTAQSRVISVIREMGSLHYDDLLRKLGDPVSLAETTLDLEISGLITRLPGNFLALRAAT